MKLTCTRIVTGNVPALASFYEELTGAKREGGDEYVEFAFPGSGLAICSKRSVDLFNAGAASPTANRSVILDFQVDDVDQEQIRVSRLVGELVLEPTDKPWGNRSMLFRDPDGNLINFFAHISGKHEACHTGKQP